MLAAVGTLTDVMLPMLLTEKTPFKFKKYSLVFRFLAAEYRMPLGRPNKFWVTPHKSNTFKLASACAYAQRRIHTSKAAT
jgi:hypothetical protein